MPRPDTRPSLSRRHPGQIAIATAVAALLATPAAIAQNIRSDTSWGRAPQSLSGPTYLIPEALGRISGSNLFHSFERFGLTASETAQFTTTTSSLQTVLARVTGGEASLIRGTVQLVPAAGSRPDLILVNPAGIAFAASARIDVPAAFHTGTAAYVRFADGLLWPTGSADSTLTSARPEAFGFLGTSAARDLNIAAGGRVVADGGLTLAAGNIAVNGAETVARSGVGDLVAVAMGTTAGEVPLIAGSTTLAPVSLPAGNGSITITNGGEIGSLGQGDAAGGKVTVRAGTLTLAGENSGLGSVALGSGNAGDVRLDIGGALTMSDQATIASSTFAGGNSGLLSISAGSVELTRSFITTAALAGSSGHAGTLVLNTPGTIVMRDRALIDSSTLSSGDAGAVIVQAAAIDAAAGSRFTSQAAVGSSGSGGLVDIDVSGTISLSSGAIVASPTFGSGNAGAVAVHARDIALIGDSTLIDSSAQTGATGNAGPVSVRADNAIFLANGGQIGSNTFGPGNADAVSVAAGTMVISGGFAGVASQAQPGSSGRAGSVLVDIAGQLVLVAGGKISSSTYAVGDAGVVTVRAGEISMSGASAQTGPSSIESVSLPVPSGIGGNAGGVAITVAGKLELGNGATIDSSTYTAGNAGSVIVAARDISLSGESAITSAAYAAQGGRAGNVEVTASGTLSLASNAAIAASTFSSKDAGSVAVRAGDIVVDNANISSTSGTATAGNAGNVQIVAETLTLREGHVATSTQSAGNSGSIDVTVGRLVMDRGSLQNQSNPGSSGNAGPIRVDADDIEIRGGALIVSGTFGSGDAGGIFVSSRRMLIDGSNSGLYGSCSPQSAGSGGGIFVDVGETLTLRGGANIDSSTLGTGDAGSIIIRAGDLSMSGSSRITSVSAGTNSGDAGAIGIDVRGTLSLADGAGISSSAFSRGDAGLIRLHAGSIALSGALIDSQTGEGSRGDGGLIDIAADRDISLRQRTIVSTSTLGAGDAGGTRITSPRISLDESFVVSAAGETASGDAGIVAIIAGDALTMTGASGITSSTRSPTGAAGTVDVRAGSIDIAGGGITSDARADSSGRVGTVNVVASGDIAIAAGGRISISNLSAAPPPDSAGSLTVSAAGIQLREGASISAASEHDIPASSIAIDVRDRLLLDKSSITTSANNGDGGAISIGTPRLVALRNSLITTSVFGTAGDGGNIDLAADAVVLDTGFIQANTAAANAAGGTVNIAGKQLLASGNSLRVGGDTAFGFFPGIFGYNVIQAAAPSGLSGNVEISSPPTDISGVLAELAAPTLELGAFGRDLCNRQPGSSLTVLGRGALPAGPSGFQNPRGRDAAAAPGATLPLPHLASLACR